MSKLASMSCVLLALTCACGPKINGNGSGTGSADGGNAGDDGQGGSGSGGSGGSACATSMVKAQQTPLDLYVMLDQSLSMDEQNKWTDVTAALDSFVTQPLTNVSIGIQFFGQPGTDGDDSCTAADYATPSVEIAPLPGVASSIQSSIAAHSPSTETPTSAALQGAVDHAKAWATAHPGDVVVDVLATDGDPTECTTSLSSIDAIAKAGAMGTPKVLTFVIGVGSSLSALNGIAAAGGTGSAFLVDTGGNTNAQFLAAMNAIRQTALGCQYAIPVPASGTPNFSEVNVNYTPGSGGTAETFPNVANAAACPASGDGWYYDNAAAPTQIILCATTCTKVEADSTGEVDVALGCATVIN